MLELAKLIHDAIGIESPRKFMAVCAIAGFVIFGCLGWLIDKGYRAKLMEQSKAPPYVNVTNGPESPIIPNNNGTVTINPDASKSAHPPKKPKPQ
ncbi:MAG: hypothetical protein ACLPND_06155 [Candidatus Korobacteraceae bacterium]